MIKKKVWFKEFKKILQDEGVQAFDTGPATDQTLYDDGLRSTAEKEVTKLQTI